MLMHQYFGAMYQCLPQQILLKAELKDTLLEGANLKMVEGVTSEQLKDAITNAETWLNYLVQLSFFG